MDTASATYSCTTCGKTFDKPKGLSMHMLGAHSEKKKVTPPEPQPVSQPQQPPQNFNKYRELPAPLVEYLELTFGEWLKEFEIGQEWKEDYGGYGLYIKVPKQYSTEWKEIKTPQYDNATRSVKGEFTEVIPDIRWKPIKDVADVKKWLDLVKNHIITNAYRKGIRLPNTNVPVDVTKGTLEQYQQSLNSPR